MARDRRSSDPNARPLGTPQGLVAEMSNEQLEKACEMVAMAAEPHRIAVLRHLLGGPMLASAIQERLELTRPGCGHHLVRLRLTGAVRSKRQGQNVYYSLTPAGRKVSENLVRLIDDVKSSI